MRTFAPLLVLSLLPNLFVSASCPYNHPDGLEKLQHRDTLPGDDGFLEQFYVGDNETYGNTDFGTPVDDTTSLKAGVRGPSLLEDFVFRTKITRFDHERIPERAVHARGAAAHGYFESYGDFSNLTAVSFVAHAEKHTPIFLRFSTVAGSRGSSDTVRDVHGFGIRFFTDEGNYDIVGNNVPVFFIQDAIQFPDLIHAVKPRPDNEIPQAQAAHDSAYDFFSQTPSTLHTLLWAMAGYGIPRSYRHIDGFGVHTFRWVTSTGESKLVKYHFKTLQGRASLLWEEALNLAGQDPDFHRKDLFNAIDSGRFPGWEVSVQLVAEEDALKFGFDLLDPTKFVPVEFAPLTPIGKIVLNRNPMNYFAETEQVMYNPGHIVRGIDFTEDPLLQGRLFSYVDTQLNRNMGSPNFEQIPINRPRVPVYNNHRDGAGQQTIPTNQFPYAGNTLHNGTPKPANQSEGNGFFSSPARKLVNVGPIREVSPTFLDHWSQPRLFFNSLIPAEQQMVINALRFELAHVQSMTVRKNFISQINKVSNDLAKRVAQAIGVPVPAPDPNYYHNNVTAGLSIFNATLPTIVGLNIGILATTTTSLSVPQASALALEFSSRGANGIVIAETLVEGASTTYSASDAVLFDGIIVVDGTTSLFGAKARSTLYPPLRPLNIVRDAFFYGKPVGAVGAGGKAALEAAGISLYPQQDGVFVVNQGGGSFAETFEGGLKRFKYLDRLPLDQ